MDRQTCADSMPSSTIDRRLSLRLTMCNVACTLMVIYRHSLNFAAFYPSGEYPDNYNTAVQSWVMCVSRVAVPLFFAMSGFLFFKGADLTLSAYGSRLRRRVRTLLVPLVIWTLINVAVMQAAGLADTTHPVWRQLIAGKYFAHLWYVRDIILFMIAAPLFDVLRRNRLVWLVALAVLFFYWKVVDCSLCSSEGIFFFLLGSGMTMGGAHRCLPLSVSAPLLVVWLVLPVVVDFGCAEIDRLYILAGVCLLWNVAGAAVPLCTVRVRTIAGYCFFIYCGHFFIIKTMKILLARQFAYNDVVALIAFWVLPIVVFALLFGVGRFMRRYVRGFYLILSGGR